MPREMLYIADEIFLSGTATEVTPIRSVDRIDDRQRQARPDHSADSAALSRHGPRPRRRHARLAHVRARRESLEALIRHGS